MVYRRKKLHQTEPNLRSLLVGIENFNCMQFSLQLLFCTYAYCISLTPSIIFTISTTITIHRGFCFAFGFISYSNMSRFLLEITNYTKLFIAYANGVKTLCYCCCRYFLVCAGWFIWKPPSQPHSNWNEGGIHPLKSQLVLFCLDLIQEKTKIELIVFGFL